MEQRGVVLLLLLLLLWRSAQAAIPGASQTAWRPIVPAQLSTSIIHRTGHGGPSYKYNLHEPEEVNQQLVGAVQNRDECALYKVHFGQKLYFEYIYYKVHMPDLKEFTLCMWTKFTNHTNDHPLFSYAVGDQPRGILSWIANTQRSSYYMMNVDGHNLYRLNYPLRLNRWYHSCQSWNGRTGEWQIWVNDERVGRGFNNRLVGHVIKGGGVAISGQEQRQLGGGFLEGEGAPPGSGGMLGELTMVQLYGVALTAGKAHRDHKHHHAHHFEHDTSNNVPPSTTTQAPVTGPPLPMHPFITGGQLNHQVKINPGAHIQIIQNGLTLRHPALPVPSEAPQPLPPAIYPEPSSTPNPFFPQQQQQPANLPFNFAKTLVGIGAGARSLPALSDDLPPVNGFSFVDRRYRETETGDAAQDAAAAAARDESDEIQTMADRVELKKIKRETPASDATEKKVSDSKQQGKATREKRSDATASATTSRRSSDRKAKRGLVFADGSIIGDSYIQQQQPASQQLDAFGADLFGGGLASFGLNQLRLKQQEPKQDEREPAEDEVRRVMNICDGCADEPFEKALIMGWRSVPKKLYSGALHVPALQACKAF